MLSNIPYKIPFSLHLHIIHNFGHPLVMAFTHTLFVCSLLCLSLTITTYASSSSYGYGPKPTYASPPPFSGYGPKPTYARPPPSSGYSPKSTHASPFPSYGYGPKPNAEETRPKPQEKEHFTTIGVQGLVYCRSGSKFGPLEGAVVRVTCLAIDANGYELAPFSLLSDATNAKGYFLATLALSELEPSAKLSECRAFLNNSPMENCDVPTDVNNGLSGTLLSSHRFLNDKKMKLYSVRPLVYTSEAKPINKVIRE